MMCLVPRQHPMPILRPYKTFRPLVNKPTLMEGNMKKLGTTANAIGVAALAILPSFNAQAENTSGIHPAGAYMGELSTAIVQVTQDVEGHV